MPQPQPPQQQPPQPEPDQDNQQQPQGGGHSDLQQLVETTYRAGQTAGHGRPSIAGTSRQDASRDPRIPNGH
jgi:hypothetical protein